MECESVDTLPEAEAERFEYPEWFMSLASEAMQSPGDLYNSTYRDSVEWLMRRTLGGALKCGELTAHEMVQRALLRVLASSSSANVVNLQSYVRRASYNALIDTKRREIVKNRKDEEASLSRATPTMSQIHQHDESRPFAVDDKTVKEMNMALRSVGAWTLFEAILRSCDDVDAALHVAAKIDELLPDGCCQKAYLQHGAVSNKEPSARTLSLIHI